jgi:PAS domain S-box-containing protein
MTQPQRLTEHSPAMEAPRTMAEAQRLLEELRIHQAELEMQAQALQESRELADQQARMYSHLLKAVPVALCRINERGTMVNANKAMERLLRRPLQALDGQMLYRFGLDESQRINLLQAVQGAAAHDNSEARQIWFSADGDPVLADVHFSKAPELQNGQPEWIVALVDQTRQHREHQALQHAHEALQKAHAVNQELALLADRSPNAVMICDSELRVRWVNPSFTHTTGYTLLEAKGRHPHDLLGSPDGHDETFQLMEQRLRRGDAIDRIHLRRQTKLGTPYWAEVSVLPIRNDDGLISRHIVIEQDITDRVQAEVEREALMRAEASHIAKTEFLSRMSHNMRTPLNAVMGFTHLLLRGPNALPTDAQKKKLEIIHQAGQQLLTLVDQALQLAKLEHALEDYAPEAVNLHVLMHECVDLVRERASEKNLALSLESPVISAMGDAQRIREITHNLLSNAIKYSPGPGTVHVRVWLDRAKHLVSIEVRDEGVGIAPDERDMIFQPFTRLESTCDMAPGHGIGLAISRRLAELMLGDLTLISAPGQGSTFTLTLPAADGPVPLPVHLDEGTEAEIALPHLRLLCVEDNAMNRLLIEAVFKHYPQVSVAMAPTLSDGRSCVELAHPEVILLDINLPDGNGLTLCRELRAQPDQCDPSKRTLVIALSADALPESISEAMEAGVDHYLVKPLQITRLLGILQTHFHV